MDYGGLSERGRGVVVVVVEGGVVGLREEVCCGWMGGEMGSYCV